MATMISFSMAGLFSITTFLEMELPYNLDDYKTAPGVYGIAEESEDGLWI